MNVISRGIRNAFRNTIRTISLVTILGLIIGLSLAMLVAHRAVGQKIDSVKSTVGNSITISPAGVRGFEGGGNPLTADQLAKIKSLPHVASVEESLNDRLTSSDTNLQSAVDAGSLGQRFAQRSGDFGGGFSGNSNSNFNPANFTPPVTVIGTTNPTDLNNTQGGGNFTLKSGQVFDGNGSDDVALVGTTLATKNNLGIGSTFTAYGQTVKVVGIFDSGNSFTNNLVVMPLKTEQALSSQSGDVTSAIVNVDSLANVASVTNAIKSQLGSAADVTNASDRAQQAIAPLQNVQSISLYSLIGAVIAGAVIILLTMIMIVRERRREIGVLKAIGGSNTKVVGQFMTEALTLTLLGAVIGVVIGVIGGNPITHTLVNNANNSTSTLAAATTGSPDGGGFVRGGRGVGGFVRSNVSNIHAAVGWTILVDGLVAALLIALIGSAIAAFFIAKVRPAEVMRAE